MKTTNVSIPKPPPTPKRPVEEVLHGVKIVDPYRWLEDGTSPETQRWTAAHNERTTQVMAQLPQKKTLSEELSAILSLGSLGMPLFRGNRLFYTRTKPG